MKPFADRRDAGRRLAEQLAKYASRPDSQTIVLGLPRGGVPVAFEVAGALGADLDVLVVRKIGVPWQLELAMGAIASGGTVIRNEDVIRHLRIPPDLFAAACEKEQIELRRREAAYRGDAGPLIVQAKQCIVVDDGIATGASMLAAVRALRSLHPARLVVAAPVAAPGVADQLLSSGADDFVACLIPPEFTSVGLWYEDFDQTDDDEVEDLLRLARQMPVHPAENGGTSDIHAR